MSDTPIPDRMRSRQMPDVVSFRARAGFRDDLRAAAEAEGVGPAEMARQAVLDRIEERRRVRDEFFAAAQVVARDLDARAQSDHAWREDIEGRLAQFQAAHHAHIVAAHRHLSLYLKQQEALNSGQPPEGGVSLAAASVASFNDAFGEMVAARELCDDFGRIVALGLEA